MRNTSFDSTRIKTIRFHLGMTQAEFAAHLGVGLSSVSDWETSRHAPKHGRLVKKLLDAEREVELLEREEQPVG